MNNFCRVQDLHMKVRSVAYIAVAANWVPETAQSNANSGNVELKQLSGVFDSG
jgi:hypothetical protein